MKNMNLKTNTTKKTTTGNTSGKKKKTPVNILLYLILPMLFFTVCYQLVGSLILIVFNVLITDLASTEELTASVNVFVSENTADISAVITAFAMLIAFLFIYRTVKREVLFSWKIEAPRNQTLVLAAGAIFFSLFLNTFFTTLGAVAADSLADASATQTADVSLLLGLLVYGVLSPFIEEIVFRGITFTRAYKVCTNGKKVEERTPKDREDKALIKAVIIASAIFAVYHGNFVQGLYAFGMGCVLCAFYALTKSLPATAILHGAINIIILLLSQGLYEKLCNATWVSVLLGLALVCFIYIHYQRMPGEET